MRVSKSTMIKFGIVFLILDTIVAGVYYYMGDGRLAAMYLGGCIIWIIGLLIWNSTNAQDHPNT